MKKIICYLLLSALLINVALNSNAFKIYGAEPCFDCTVAPSKVINEWVDDSESNRDTLQYLSTAL